MPLFCFVDFYYVLWYNMGHIGGNGMTNRDLLNLLKERVSTARYAQYNNIRVNALMRCLKDDNYRLTVDSIKNEKFKYGKIQDVVKNEYGIEAVAHLTCISSTKKEVLEMCEALKEKSFVLSAPSTNMP